MSAYSQMLVEKSSRKQELWFRFDSDVFWLQDFIPTAFSERTIRTCAGPDF